MLFQFKCGHTKKVDINPDIAEDVQELCSSTLCKECLIQKYGYDGCIFNRFLIQAEILKPERGD